MALDGNVTFGVVKYPEGWCPLRAIATSRVISNTKCQTGTAVWVISDTDCNTEAKIAMYPPASAVQLDAGRCHTGPDFGFEDENKLFP